MGKRTRQLWKAYVEGRGTTARNEPLVSTPSISLSKYRGCILGIDPSLRATGLAVVIFSPDGRTSLTHHETIKVPASRSSTQCLAAISERCTWVVDHFPIEHVAVEQTIYVQNYRTAMILGSAKGAALGVLASRGLEIFEYPPLRVKQAVVGQGRATKKQVAQMVSQILSHQEWGSADETDAAGVAICHGFTHKVAIPVPPISRVP
jgi:crossover junction endodeoxyribonuclease RuvC